MVECVIPRRNRVVPASEGNRVPAGRRLYWDREMHQLVTRPTGTPSSNRGDQSRSSLGAAGLWRMRG